ncbi:ARM repeat-containing protein [Schizopora paradoxa]|uniref:ARM repeat-containing protein n=1 Tax=Schizopora paradoxa TaxID=27342 RepID=A0A0H2SKR7_9AGAM|nr:ARM repeat-containing protein [Schizopora paradoxa]
MRNAESFASKADNEGLNVGSSVAVGSSSAGNLYNLHGQGPEDGIEVEDEQNNRVAENVLESGISGESEAKGIAEPGRISTVLQSISDSLESENSEVRELLSEITSQNFEVIFDQIIILVNTSDAEKDGHTLRQFVNLVMENVIGGEKSARLCARLCRKVMEQISPNIIDKDFDRPIAGAQLFRKYLLNICQEKFECIFEREENVDAEGELGMETTHQSSNLVRFVGELFEVQILAEKIIHGCIKKFLKDIDNPKEAYIESLCALLKVVGKSLDKEKANFHINVYFERMSEISRKENISSRMKSILLEVIELRQSNWVARNTAQANPIPIAEVHGH